MTVIKINTIQNSRLKVSIISNLQLMKIVSKIIISSLDNYKKIFFHLLQVKQNMAHMVMSQYQPQNLHGKKIFPPVAFLQLVIDLSSKSSHFHPKKMFLGKTFFQNANYLVTWEMSFFIIITSILMIFAKL